MSNIRPISGELAKMAKSELNEVPSRIPEDIQTIKTWISKQPHLKPICNDQFLVNFLRGCKYSLERTKQKIDKYFTIKTSMPEIFTERDPTDPNLLKIIRLGYVNFFLKISVAICLIDHFCVQDNVSPSNN